MGRKARYGRTHMRIRAALLPFAYGTTCPHCGLPMLHGEKLHLDHTADGSGYRGFAHALCNMREGGRRGRAKQLSNRRRGELL